MKTFIRRPGNKSKHLKHIVPLIPENYGTYLEPFVGTGALFLRLLPNNWIINDLNSDVLGCWNLVKDEPEYLLEDIDKFKEEITPLSNPEKLLLCKEITSQLDGYTGKKRASFYLIISYCSFIGCIERGGGFKFSTLYSHIYNNDSLHIFTETYKKKVREISLFLKNGSILNTDYKKVLEMAKKGDFVFLDPPYVMDYAYSFSYLKKDQAFSVEDLAFECQKLDDRGVKFLMTNTDGDQTRKLFSKYKSVEYINNNSTPGRPSSKKEVIFFNY